MASDELARLTKALEDKLPDHTFNAVMHRAGRCKTDEERQRLLTDILANRERDEAARV